MNIYREPGELIIGSRLRRISERILYDIGRIYKDREITFEAAWFPVFYLLDRQGPMTVGEIAKALEISQPGASQVIGGLVRRQLVAYQLSRQDRRIRRLGFTPAGEQLLHEIKPVWEALRQAVQGMLGESPRTGLLMAALDDLEDMLERHGIFPRVLELLEAREGGALRAAPLQETDLPAYRTFLLAWLGEAEGGFHPESLLVNDPAGWARCRPGAVWLAWNGQAVAGVAAAESNGGGTVGLPLLAVLPGSAQSAAGRVLLDQVFSYTRESGSGDVTVALYSRPAWLFRLLRETGFQLEPEPVADATAASGGPAAIVLRWSETQIL